MSACWIVAEAGVNWNGDRTKIVALIEAAKQAGASHVKFQAFNADALIARRKITDQKTIDLLRRNELTDADLDMIQHEAGVAEIAHFYSVFDPGQIERVLSRGACALKIGHAEAGYAELDSAICKTLNAWRGTPQPPLWVSGKEGSWSRCNVLCTAEYPAKSPANLHLIGTPEMVWQPYEATHELEYQWRGFSSHYQDYRIPAAAALRGADYIEAHLKLGPRQHWPEEERGYTVPQWIDDEPEAAWSLNPEDFGKMVKLIREYEGWL